VWRLKNVIGPGIYASALIRCESWRTQVDFYACRVESESYTEPRMAILRSQGGKRVERAHSFGTAG
jgi:hypothetical protein